MNALAPVPPTKAEQDELVVSNVGLVYHIAGQYHGRVEFEDRVGWGCLGLIRAARDYDPTRGFKFAAYAGWWIRSFIMRSIVDDVVGTNSNYRTVFYGLRRAIREIEEVGGDATDEAVAERIGVSVGFVTALRAHLLQGEVRIDSPRRSVIHVDDVSGGSIESRFCIANRNTPEHDAIENNERANTTAMIRTVMETMKPREQEVIQRRHLAHDPETLQAIGGEWGVTRERVRQVEAKALRKLKRGLERLKR